MILFELDGIEYKTFVRFSKKKKKK